MASPADPSMLPPSAPDAFRFCYRKSLNSLVTNRSNTGSKAPESTRAPPERGYSEAPLAEK
jgi:hypothetical protein